MLYCPTNYSLITVFSDAKDNGDTFWGGESAWDSCHEKCDACGADDDNTTGLGKKKKSKTFRADFCAAAHTENCSGIG